MPLEIQLVGILVLFLLFLVSGMPIPFAIGASSLICLYWLGGMNAFKGIAIASWGSMNSFVLTAIPLFVLMADLLQRSGLTTRIYHGLSTLVARIPGGLLQTNVVGCAAFAAISGSSITTAAAIGSVVFPELKKRKYDRRLVAGSLAAGGTLGILIPPSLAMIIYSTFTNTSVAQLFVAGLIPGILLTLLFMAYVAARAIIDPSVAPSDNARPSLRAYLSAIIEVAPMAGLIFITLGCIYFGITTPTEAAALGCLLSVLLCLFYRVLSWKLICQSLRSTVLVSGNILFIVVCAYLFAYAISYAGIGRNLVELITYLDMSRVELYIALIVMYVILGCFVESVGMIVITVPIIFPVLANFDIDLIWFGVVLVVLIEIGQITPPLGINLFVVQGMWDGKLGDVILGVLPFFALMILLLVLLMIWPQIALWLPSQMYQ